MGGSFTTLQYGWLATGILLFIIAVVLYLKGKTGLSLIVLTAGGFILRLLMTNTDPFIYDWDEQYHALVAKNLADHPGIPKLYNDPLLHPDEMRWDRNHIWLHKPPLFLWLIAISIKIFGATPFAVKFPSILLTTLMIPSLYFTMKRLAGERTGWIAALLLAAHSYSIQLVSGFRNTDHNDVIFSAFILFSVGAWVKYSHTLNRRDAILTGVLAGCAILVKWLPGLFVFLVWGMWMLSKENRSVRQKWFHLIFSFIIAIMVVLPWYLFTGLKYPDIVAVEMESMHLHFTFPLDGHDGPWYYQLDATRELLGWTIAIISIPGLLLLATRDTRQKRGLYLAIAVVFFFMFYSIAETKMPLFVLPIIPFLLAGVAVLIDYALSFVSGRKIIIGIALSAIAIFIADPRDIIVKHSSLSELADYRSRLERDRNRSGWIQEQCGEGKWVVMGYPDHIRASHMFYTGQIAYSDTLTDSLARSMHDRGYQIAVIQNSNSSSYGEQISNVKIITLPDSLK